MPQYIKCSRDRYVRTLEGAGIDLPGGCTPEWESGTPYGATVTVTMELTPEQVVQIFSALMTGCDLLYPEVSHELMWLYWKALECP